uniref:RRM domain-containing protein n=1 Tax=Chenopodium quinoa TaxID=63459 RepID=A0A803M8R2_CHEQI
MHQQRLKQQQQQQAMMQQSILQQQASLYHPGVLAAPPQVNEDSGALCLDVLGSWVFSFEDNGWKKGSSEDPISKCMSRLSECSLWYVGNIHPQVTDPLLQEVFSSTGLIEGCKLIRKEKSSYGFVDYYDRRSASLAIVSLNGRHLFGQPIKVNWAYASSQREDTTNHHNIFVGDLSPEVTDATLFACFSAYQSCSDARVMWDQKTGRSRGFGFVSFRSQQDAQSAINDQNGKWLGSRQIRCNWASKGAVGGDDKPISDTNSAVELPNGSSEEGQEKTNDDAPVNNPQYTTVYVGNLASEASYL